MQDIDLSSVLCLVAYSRKANPPPSDLCKGPGHTFDSAKCFVRSGDGRVCIGGAQPRGATRWVLAKEAVCRDGI